MEVRQTEVDGADESPIEFAVSDELTDENGTPKFSVWMNLDSDEGVHAPIFTYSTGAERTWNSLKREWGTAEYEQPTEDFWWCLEHHLEHWQPDVIKGTWNELPVYERVFFNAIIQGFTEMELPDEMGAVLTYATEGHTDFEMLQRESKNEGLDEYGSGEE